MGMNVARVGLVLIALAQCANAMKMGDRVEVTKAFKDGLKTRGVGQVYTVERVTQNLVFVSSEIESGIPLPKTSVKVMKRPSRVINGGDGVMPLHNDWLKRSTYKQQQIDKRRLNYPVDALVE